MSFFALLVLLSLIIIVPIFFVLTEKSKRTQVQSIRQHQEYLAAAKTTMVGNQQKTVPKQRINQQSIIEFSANHPFIQLLYDEQVPVAFRAIMDDIGQQYERTHHQHVTESQLFTLNKLIDSRIPELLRDYLSLDPDYATTVIIDTDKAITSYTMVLAQLQSILDFAQKINNQSQSGVVDKLLASQRYLAEVSQDSGMVNDILNIK
ncbi:hypothetical protein [Psychrobacter urativorans]|uniref:Uncharacterized protein n=1 Tax=Psychrobacter urativorans TaxID=45610 RepID=A0A0M4SYI0_9GAMM|nr:hypothetical protein [Psychrobacter urativorans]ALF60135.1 hypothetical protein AOC03_08865 [Psychrobacter urativorans]